MQFQAILFPYELCVTEKKMCKQIEYPHVLTVFSAAPLLLPYKIDVHIRSGSYFDERHDSKKSLFKRYLSKGAGFRLLEYLRDFITNLSYLRISISLGYFIFQSHGLHLL